MPASRNSRVFSWALYDFANTIFSMNIISMFFPLWVTGDMGGKDIHYSFAVSGSMLAAGLTMPVIGAVSDRTRKRVPYLALFTLVCSAATFGIGLAGSLAAGLVLFALANYAYHTALVPYDAMLPEVSEGGSIGRVAGLGVGLGYVGTIFGLLAVGPIVERYGRQAAFIPTAILFLVFALPVMLVTKDKAAPAAAGRVDIPRQFKKIRNTLANTRRYPGLLRFLIANVLFADAVNTVIVFMAVYASKVVGMDDAQIMKFMITSTVFAAAGSFAAGRLTDRVGPQKALVYILWLWVFTLTVAGLSFSRYVFWAVGPLAGVSLGGTWVASRSLVAKLAPPRKYGEVYGLYNLGGKFGSVAGPLIWGGTILLFEPYGLVSYRIAIFTLAALVMVSLMVLRGLPPANPLEKRP
jgi:UMF1 family MFS transporter